MDDEVEVTTIDGTPTAADVPELGGMPMLGLGTWKLTDPEVCPEMVETALDIGYRHVDTAEAYGNEELVGDAIAASTVDREEIFLATKVWIESLDYESALESAYDSLDKLGVDYVDLLYVHWPAGEYDSAYTLEAFDELYENGVAERIGVANFQPDQLEEAVERTSAPIFANQVECHPLLPQEGIRETCEAHDVRVVAYSPLARGEVFDVPEISDVAEHNGVSEAQVSLAWLRQKGIAAIPKASTEAHLRDNWQSLSLRLDDADVEALDAIERVDRQVDPDFAPWN